MSAMKVLVTGGRGLLGSATVSALQASGHDVTVFQRTPSGTGVREVLGSVEDAGALRRAMVGHDVVVHGAARVTFAGAWQEFVATNVTGTRHVIDEARKAGVRAVVYVSSPSVAHAGEPLVGVGAEPADPDGARGHYARSKALAEQFVLAADDVDLATVAIRPHLVWGPGDTQLIARIAERARSGRLALVGSGQALIDSTYVDNAADALVAAAERACLPAVRGRPFVVTNGEPRTVEELVASITRAMGAPEPRRHVPYALAHAAGWVIERAWERLGRTDEPPMTAFLAEQLATAHWFDQRATRQALEWSPRVTLDEGFRRLAAHERGATARP